MQPADFDFDLPDDRVDTSRLAETEDNPVLGTRWWSREELRSTREQVYPEELLEVLDRLGA